MTFEHILFSEQNGVATIRLNRPKVFNSFTMDMAKEVQRALDYCAETASVRAIVLTGEGRAFCAGQDLQEATDPNGPDMSTIVQTTYNPIVMRLRSIEKPIVAAVNGVAAGAGANIALACDICMATASASFIQAFSKIGLIPDSGGTFVLPRLIGMQKATAYMMTGEKVSAEEAERVGMIYKVIPDEEFVATYTAFAEKMAAMPTQGLGLTKRLLNKSFTNSLEEQLHQEDVEQTVSGNSNDYKEGVAAFLEKRKPVFKGN